MLPGMLFNTLAPYPRTQQASFRLVLHTIPSMLKVKQESCEYQLFKSFGPTQQGNPTQVYRLRVYPLDHAPVVIIVKILILLRTRCQENYVKSQHLVIIARS